MGSSPEDRLASVARVDFQPLTNEEESKLKEKHAFNVRKAVVKFKDKTPDKTSIFLYIGQITWKGPTEEGNLDGENVVSVVFR